MREIAEYGEMRLHLTDYYLEGCRNIKKQLTVGGDQLKDKPFFMISDGVKTGLTKEEAEKKFREFFGEAERLINETGYHRRDGELEELKSFL